MHTKETHFYLTDILHKLILTNSYVSKYPNNFLARFHEFSGSQSFLLVSIFPSRPFVLLVINCSSFLTMVAKFQSEMASTIARNTMLKTVLQGQKSKDPNARVFTDTSGRVFETLHLDWSRIYTIFYNEDFSIIPTTIPHMQGFGIPSSTVLLHNLL